MKELKAKGLLNDKEIKAMFGNMEELLPVHQNLLQLINKKREESPVIGMLGDVLLRTVDTLKVYDTYCTNYPMAMQLYKDLKANREEMRAYLGNTVNVTEFRGLSLESFLIKPVQRICKYPLLLKVCSIYYA